MLLEFLRYATAQSAPHVKKLGLVRELAAIEARAARRRREWAPHLARCKDLALQAAAGCPRKDLAVVLGSGPLLDVPLEELAAAFGRVLLVDAAHLRASRRRAGRFPNVELVLLDVTGLAGQAARLARNKGGPPLVPRPPEAFLDLEPDLVVSANLLSQLPLPFLNVLEGLPGYGPAALRALARDVLAAHLDWLARFSGRVCLVADLLWIYADGDVILEERDALRGLRLPPGATTWLWELAPRGEQSYDYERRNLVAGYEDFGAAAARAGRAWSLVEEDEVDEHRQDGRVEQDVHPGG